VRLLTRSAGVLGPADTGLVIVKDNDPGGVLQFSAAAHALWRAARCDDQRDTNGRQGGE